jgi:hypothetical protein
MGGIGHRPPSISASARLKQISPPDLNESPVERAAMFSL